MICVRVYFAEKPNIRENPNVLLTVKMPLWLYGQGIRTRFRYGSNNNVSCDKMIIILLLIDILDRIVQQPVM